ncbi:MAG: hypothetical protein A3F40_03820 [Chlamydiae bacterium RIFCSPHIGHO2_12_FULL_27_8]|nr:MAG: hypothetical protein A3F40_03820 [Chlamydiae bacterium RIFCSPHIGHO2_12_FULL_27_8]OGN65505.1 MAG: hypothetical protein A2888_01515 [Chlamydiae bacterium RIFCSPLOWO2_01_FULL_28_7]
MNKALILRHKKENLKKCSLKGLEKDSRFIFLTYPKDTLPDLSDYLLLKVDGEKELSVEDSNKKIFLIDSTWRYLDKILKTISQNIQTRSLPKNFVTAYPRVQTGCIDEERGLASIEALYISFFLTKKDYKGLLDNFYWKEKFLELNRVRLS